MVFHSATVPTSLIEQCLCIQFLIELSSPLPSVEKEWTHNKSCGFLTLLLKLMKIWNLGQKLLLCGFSSCSCCRDKIYLDHLSFFKILSEFQGEQNCRPQQLRKWTFYFDKVKNGHLTLSESSKKSANAFCNTEQKKVWMSSDSRPLRCSTQALAAN